MTGEAGFWREDEAKGAAAPEVFDTLSFFSGVAEQKMDMGVEMCAWNVGGTGNGNRDRIGLIR